jgi:hypothetical protein
MTMRKALYAVLLTGLFVLMLSALVVTPETAETPAAVDLSADFHAAFHPLVSVILPDAAAVTATQNADSAIFGALPVLLFCAAPLSALRDANGRVLSAVRYENSVYQLFRPEVAGG